jgi:hypothetical protein
MKHYSFPIDNDQYAHLIAHHLEKCISFHTTRWGKFCFIWLEEL